MTDAEFDAIRDKDHVVLTQIQAGDRDVQQLTAATTLTNSEVNYCFRKLEDLGLIEVEKPDGMVDRVVDGTRQVFEAPKQATLTEKATQYLEWSNRSKGESYDRLTHDELVQRVHELEADIERLQQAIEMIRRQALHDD
jgi:predicted transcriptional regulator